MIKTNKINYLLTKKPNQLFGCIWSVPVNLQCCEKKGPLPDLFFIFFVFVTLKCHQNSALDKVNTKYSF